MLYIIYPSSSWWNYIIDGLKENNSVIILRVECSSMFIRIVRKCFKIFKIYPLCLYYSKIITRKLNNMQCNDRLLLVNMDITNVNILNLIVKNTPIEVKTYYWLSNPLRKTFVSKTEIVQTLHDVEKLGITCCTFDSFDAEQFNLPLLNQVYRYHPNILQLPTLEYDFYFLGAIKDRKEKIENLRSKLLESFFINFLTMNNLPFISYEQNISNILKSKCIVDIVQKDQQGLTLRPLEAMFFQKKLLTDYKEIIYYDFYNPQNIFIIGVDNWDTINSFLLSPYEPIDEEIIESYEVNKWIEYFLNE